MERQHGFSLMEILISLLILTTISLGLLNQQFLIKRQLIQLQHQLAQVVEQENQDEACYPATCRHFADFRSKDHGFQ